MVESPKDISGLGLDGLKALLVQALEENADQVAFCFSIEKTGANHSPI